MIPLFKVRMSEHALAAVSRVFSSGHIAQGPVVDQFEAALAKELGCSPGHVVTVNSGTSAIHLGLVLAGVGPGDTVAVSPMTCAASIVPILHLGAHPLWIDVDPETGNMDPASLHWRLRSDTKAIIAVDWAGRPCDYDAIHEAANGIPVIEDAAHAYLARDVRDTAIVYQIALHAHFIAHSFQAIKHLTTGDGGALIVPSALAHDARKLRWFGFDRTSSKDFRCAQDLDVAGYKMHMNDIAAAIGLANIDGARDSVLVQRVNAKIYDDAFKKLEPERVARPPWDAGASWWLYTLRVDDRDKFQVFMHERGIETSQVHRRNDEHPVFRRAANEAGYHRPLENLNIFARRQVAIPVHWALTADEINRIIEAVVSYARS